MKKLLLGLAVPIILLMFCFSSCEKEDSSNTASGDTIRPTIQLDDISAVYYLGYHSGTTIVETEKVIINGVASDETLMNRIKIRVYDHQTTEYVFEKNIELAEKEISFSEEWNATEIGHYTISISAYDHAGNFHNKSEKVTYLN